MKITSRLAALALALFFAGAVASASPLTPSQALAAARGAASEKGMRAPGVAMSLVKTVNSGSSPAVYIFAADCDRPGFIIASADDAFAPLLGFSTEAPLDVDNLPPAFVWWINGYAHAVSQAAERGMSPATSAPQALASDKFSGVTVALRAPMAAPQRDEIAPIVRSQWNQNAPYNNQCPLIEGQRAYTGCVATAIAQVMKVHRWPTSGTGSHSYTFQYGGNTYTDSFDFEGNTFDWNNMPNGFSLGSTAVQKAAVAKLMHAVGVASNMGYGLTGSGANSMTAAKGLITWLKYDRAMACLDRKWFTMEQWCEKVYAELAEGRPVYYAGDDGSSGHAFVCDGYLSDNQFHINWGWGGAADGYFLFTDLNPYTQGIGGGSGEDGFNYGQEAYFGMKPAVEGSELAPVLALSDNFATSAQTYTRSSSTYVTFTSPYYSFSVDDLTVTVGLELVTSEGISQYVSLFNAAFSPLTGYTTLDVRTTDFPVGSYDVYPVCKTANGEWTRFYYDVEYNKVGGVHMTVTSSKITVSELQGIDEATITAELKSSQPVRPGDEGFYPGHAYKFNFALEATSLWSGEIDCILFDSSGSIKAYDEKMLTLQPSTPLSDTWTVTVPADLAPGSYYLGLATYDSTNGYTLLVNYSMNVTEAPATEYPLTLSLIGDANGDGWSGTVATVDGVDGVYIFNDILINNAGGGYGNIIFTATEGSTQKIYGATAADAILDDATPLYTAEMTDGNLYSWKVAATRCAIVVDLRSATVTLYKGDAAPGDANSDGAVNATDLAYVIDRMLGIDHPELCFNAADFNADGVIDATDVSGIITSLFADTKFFPATSVVAAHAGNTFDIKFDLMNLEQYTTFQWWLDAPAGLEVVYDEEEEEYLVDFGSRLTANYAITADYKTGTHSFLVLGLNTTGKKLMPCSDGLFCTMTLLADGIASGQYWLDVRDSCFNWLVTNAVITVRPNPSKIRVIVIE